MKHIDYLTFQFAIDCCGFSRHSYNCVTKSKQKAEGKLEILNSIRDQNMEQGTAKSCEISIPADIIVDI